MPLQRFPFHFNFRFFCDAAQMMKGRQFISKSICLFAVDNTQSALPSAKTEQRKGATDDFHKMIAFVDWCQLESRQEVRFFHQFSAFWCFLRISAVKSPFRLRRINKTCPRSIKFKHISNDPCIKIPFACVFSLSDPLKAHLNPSPKSIFIIAIALCWHG